MCDQTTTDSLSLFEETFAGQRLHILSQICNHVRDPIDRRNLCYSAPIFADALQLPAAWEHISAVTLMQKHMLPDMDGIVRLQSCTGQQILLNLNKDVAALDKLSWYLRRATHVRQLTISIDSFWYKNGIEIGQTILERLLSSFEHNAFHYLRTLYISIELHPRLLPLILPITTKLTQKCVTVDIQLTHLNSSFGPSTTDALAAPTPTLLLPYLDVIANIQQLSSLQMFGSATFWQYSGVVPLIGKAVKDKAQLNCVNLTGAETSHAASILTNVSHSSLTKVTLLLTDFDRAADPCALLDSVTVGMWHNVTHLKVTHHGHINATPSLWARWFQKILSMCPSLTLLSDHLSKIQPTLQLIDAVAFVNQTMSVLSNRATTRNNLNNSLDVAMFAPKGIKIHSTLDDFRTELAMKVKIAKILYGNFYDLTIVLPNNLGELTAMCEFESAAEPMQDV